MIDKCVHQRFSSRLGLLLSVLGIAIGTGNIWRFPRIAAQNGGEEGAGAFLIAWVVFLFLWSIPLIIAEYALGRKYRSGVVSTVGRAAGGKYSWMGAFVAFVALAISFYYAVVVGWCIFYFIRMLAGALPDSSESAVAIWDGFQGSTWPLLFHALAMSLGGLAIWRGIRSIEKINKLLIPALLFIIVVALIRVLTLPGATSGIAYLFKPQLSLLTKPNLWLEALTQNAWDTGAGWGLFLTYAAYMKREHGVVKNAFTTGIGNNTISLLAGIIIFGTVFAVLKTEMALSKPEILEIMRTSGPASTGLTFIWIPQLFARMFLGKPIAIIFFLGLAFAGFSSLIAMLELSTRVLVDAGFKRTSAMGLVIGTSYLIGIPSAINLNFLSNQDFVWGVALIISGAFIAYTIIQHGGADIRQMELLTDRNDWNLGSWWEKLLKFFVPFAALALLLWWLSLSAMVYSPDQWYNPFNAYSVMTCLVQWLSFMLIFLICNKKLAKRFKIP